MALRYDIGTLRPAEKTADGRLRADAAITRTGVFDYRNPDGSIRREYRPAAEVFKADSLDSFAMVPVTDDHPPVLIDAKNARQYAVGAMGETLRRDGDHVIARLTVFDAATIAKMETGKVQLSCGYHVDVLETPGVTSDGQRYDAVQTNIRGNHVAIVNVARAGDTARVRMDGAEMIEGSDVARKDETMTLEEMQAALAAEKTRADALQSRIDAMPPALAKAAKGGKGKAGEGDDEDEDEDEMPAFLKKKIAKSDAKITELETALAAATNEARDQKLRADKAESARADEGKASMVAARARITLEDKARAILGDEFKADAEDRDLMVAVVKRVDGEDVPADASADFVRGLYAGASRRFDSGASALASVRRTITTDDRADAADDEETAARKMRERSNNAWKSTNGGE